jgi:hypothetical protein
MLVTFFFVRQITPVVGRQGIGISQIWAWGGYMRGSLLGPPWRLRGSQPIWLIFLVFDSSQTSKINDRLDRLIR